MESIISALIAGGLALIGVIFTNSQGNKQIENNLKTSQAVMDTKIEKLTEELKKHNEYWMKVPVIENRLDALEEDVKELRKNGFE